MNNQTIYWVWLQQALGYASKRILSLITKYTFVEDFYRAPLREKLRCCDFTLGEQNRLANTSLNEAKRIVNKCRDRDYEIIALTDPSYPQLLLEIINPPVVLYVRGKVSSLNAAMNISMVGTRNASPQGKKAAQRIAYSLAKNGVTIVSGGAVGIDSCSHQGALNAGGTTICVLGCGLDDGYLSKNRDMRNEIAAHGAIISEYPPDAHATKYTFPARNRIISGMSRGVVVVEAGARSGSLITANFALEQNRDVFAIPGDINSSLSLGTNDLLKSGAKAITTADDIMRDYEYLFRGRAEDAVNTAKLFKAEQDFEEQICLDGFNDLPNYTARNERRQSEPTAPKAPTVQKSNRTAAQNAKLNRPKKQSDSEEARPDLKKVQAPSTKTSAAPENTHINSEKTRSVSKKTRAAFEKTQVTAEAAQINLKDVSSPAFSEEKLSELSENARAVLELFLKEKKLHIDSVKRKSGLNIGSVHAVITELELGEFIVSLAGRMYELNESAR